MVSSDAETCYGTITDLLSRRLNFRRQTREDLGHHSRPSRRDSPIPCTSTELSSTGQQDVLLPVQTARLKHNPRTAIPET